MVAISFFSIFKVNYSLFILDVIQLDKLVKQFNCILNVAQYTTVHHTLWSCFDSIEKSGKKNKLCETWKSTTFSGSVQREEVIKVHLTLIFELFPVYWDTSTWSISHGTIVFHVFHRLHLMVVIKYLLGYLESSPGFVLDQRFSIPVLAPPRSAYFVCYSYRFRCLFYSNASALRSGHHRIFRHDSSSKRTYTRIFHSKCIEVCKTWIKIVYIYRGIWCHTRPCVKTLRSANPWMNVPKWSKLQRISPAQGVGSMSVGTQLMHGAHF